MIERPEVVFVVWDCMGRGALSSENLVAAIKRLEGGPVYAVAVDTGTDNYTVALSQVRLSAAQALQMWLSQPDAA